MTNFVKDEFFWMNFYDWWVCVNAVDGKWFRLIAVLAVLWIAMHEHSVVAQTFFTNRQCQMLTEIFIRVLLRGKQNKRQRHKTKLNTDVRIGRKCLIFYTFVNTYYLHHARLLYFCWCHSVCLFVRTVTCEAFHGFFWSLLWMKAIKVWINFCASY